MKGLLTDEWAGLRVLKKWLVSLLETSISRKVLPTLGPRDQ